MIMKVFTFFAIVVLLQGCGKSFLEAIQSIDQSNDPDYGYTTSDAIQIGYFDPQTSIRATYSYLSCLRTPAGKKFIIKRMGSFGDGSYRKSILDGYSLVDGEAQDTVVLYFDIYNSSSLKIPNGMKWDAPKQQ